jgi:hypothetical protein
MGHDTGSFELNFQPHSSSSDIFFSLIAEHSIARTIIEGSGGPNNEEMTEEGLRFIRYLLSISRSARFGFIPNFKDPEIVAHIAKQFISYCGGAAKAVQTMNRIIMT